MSGPDPRRVSDQLVRLVQLLFGLVAVQPLLLYGDVFVQPFAYEHRTAVFALLAVYVTTVSSWIDWHITMEARPYDIYRRVEKARLVADMLVVVTYAYLLLTIEPFANNPNADIAQHLIGYPLVFASYALSGVLRRWAYGPLATNLLPIIVAFLAVTAIVLSYTQTWCLPLLCFGGLGMVWRNVMTIVGVVLIMLLYRAVRYRYGKRRRAKKDAGLTIGIDVDGVLGDQITQVLPRVHRRLGVQLAYEDIIDWRLPIGTSDIGKEIEAAFHDPDYISGMPVHDGAVRLVRDLYPDHRIIVVTARPESALQLTERWLSKTRLWHDELIYVKEASKSTRETSILVDDYLGNVVEYLRNTPGVAVLVDRPWNRSRHEVADLIKGGRLYVVGELSEVLDVVRAVEAALASRTAVGPPKMIPEEDAAMDATSGEPASPERASSDRTSES